jgi:hypothetical protein
MTKRIERESVREAIGPNLRINELTVCMSCGIALHVAMSAFLANRPEFVGKPGIVVKIPIGGTQMAQVAGARDPVHSLDFLR